MNITRVSVDSAGNQGNQSSIFAGIPSISPDGRFVAFISAASNLVPGDTNASDDIFVRDTLANTTIRVSVDSAGNQANSDSSIPFISADRRFVVFESNATNLVPGDTNNERDIFVRDLLTNTTTRVSVDSASNQANSGSYIASISADGRFVAFSSFASNLVPGDTNNTTDVFVRDTLANTTTRVSVDSAGNQANDVSYSYLPSISADGRFVAFESNATNLVPGDTNDTGDIFVRDTLTNTTTRVSVDSAGNQGNGGSVELSMSADGRFVAFSSFATNLVPGDTNDTSDIFVRDTLTNTTTRVSVDSAGNQGNGVFGSSISISPDGRFVAFDSTASNLVPGDTNNERDIFVRDTLTNTTTRVSVGSAGNQGN
ncbi:TolB family protein, partial [Microcoleus sp. Pol7_B1]